MKKLIFGLVALVSMSCDMGAEKTEFSWDFSKIQTYIYSFEQVANVEYTIEKNGTGTRARMISKGHLSISIKENNLADFSLTDISTDIIKYNKHGLPRDTVTRNTPPTVFQNMKPTSTFDEESANLLITKIMPLPTHTIGIGDTVNIPLQMTFRYSGYVLYAKGANVLTFDRMETIDNRTCAVLTGELNLAINEVPQNMKGSYENTTIGKGTYYFDIENQIYYGADVTISQVNSMDSSSGYARSSNEEKYIIRLLSVGSQD